MLLVLILLFSLAGGSVSADAALCRMASEITSKWDLWNQGTCLRGANLWQTVIDPESRATPLWPTVVGPPYSVENLKKLSQLGANYINFSVPGLFNEAPPYHLNKTVEANLDLLLKTAEAADLFVVISFRTGPARNEKGFSSSDIRYHQIWQNNEAQEAWVAQWKYVAEKYSKNPIVVGFDLMVEPNANAVALNIWDPEEFYPRYKDTSYDWNLFSKRMLSAIREVDPVTPVLISSSSYGSAYWLPWVETVRDSNVVYVVHHYDPFTYTHQKPPLVNSYPGQFRAREELPPESIDKAWLAKKLSPIGEFKRVSGAPVAANEYGVMRWEIGAEKYIQDQLEIFEGYAMNHAIWLWESSLDKIDWDDFNFRHGPDPQYHSDVEKSALLDVLKANWAQNRVRPSNVSFKRNKPGRRLRGEFLPKPFAAETSRLASGIDLHK